MIGSARKNKPVLFLAAQSNYFIRNCLDDMYPVHTVKICCPVALFLGVGVVVFIFRYLGEAAS